MIFLLILIPILFNLTGIVDTFLTKRLGSDQQEGMLHSSTGTLMIIGGSIAGIISLVLLPFIRDSLSGSSNSVIFLLSGFAYGLAAYPYFKSLHLEKIENIVPLLQTIPIFSFILAVVFLGENMQWSSILLIVVIVITTAAFAWNFGSQKFNRKGAFFILGSALLYALSFVIFKLGGGETIDIRSAFFREHLGISAVSLLRAIPTKIRRSTFAYLRSGGIKFGLFNTMNELFYIIGMMLLNFLILSYPVAYINTISSGLQPLFAFFMVWLAYKIWPKVYERNYSKKELLFKFGLCIITFILLGFFFFTENIS